METAKSVTELLTRCREQGKSSAETAWTLALACVGWAYVFGARGQYCDPVNRRSYYSSHGDEHPTIKSACKNFNGSDKEVGKCFSCKWYPGGRTRFFDCRGFTYWIIKQVTGQELIGAGATSQWNRASNWSAKGEIATMPKDTLVCLFVKKGNTMEHTGFGLNNETVECSAGVQHFTKRNRKWTHWAVPAMVYGEVNPPTPTPEPIPDTDKPTLRKGSKGEYVKELQKGLQKLGYDLGSCGVDGDFGRATKAAVRAFQADRGLKIDGICGPATWAALDSPSSEPTPEPITLYTVHIPCLTEDQANGLIAQHSGSWKTTE